MYWQTILKQGDCYKLTFNWLMENGGGKDMKLVHADVVGLGGDAKGKTYGHAFILLGENTVLDVCTNTTIDKKSYYEVGQVTNAKEYTLQEAVQKAVIETGHFGPW